MADRVYEIEFRTTVTGGGADQVKQELQDVGQEASSLDASLKNVNADPIAELKKQFEQAKTEAEQVAQKLNSVSAGGKESAAGILEASTAAETFAQKAQGLSVGVQGLAAQLNSGGTSASGWVKSISAATSATGGLGTQLLGLTGVIGGFIGAMVLVNEASKKFADYLLSLGEPAADAAKAIEKIENVRLDLSDQKKSIDDFTKSIQEAKRESLEFEKIANDFQNQKAKTDKARIESQAKKDIAGAGGDPNAEAAIRAKADQDIAAIDASREIAQIDSEITVLKREVLFLTEQKKGIESQTVEANERGANATEKIAEIAEGMGISFKEAERLGKSAERLNKAIEKATSDAERINLEILGQAVKTRDAANSVTDSSGSQLSGIEVKLEQLITQLATAELKKEEAELNKQSQGVDLGASSMAALQAIEKAIRDQERAVAAARQNVTNAQLNTGPGAGLAQNAAQSELAAAEAELTRLKTLAASAASTVQEGAKIYGDSFQAGADGIQTAAVTAKTKMDTAAGEVKASGETASKSIDDAAKGLDKAVASTSSQVGGSVEKLGSTISQGFEGMARRIENMANTTYSRLQSLESRLANAEADARAADNLSKQTAAKVNNSR